MPGTYLVTFPAYALLGRRRRRAVLVRHGGGVSLPLFTDRDAARTYADRSDTGACVLRRLPTPAALAAFLRAVPVRPGRRPPDRVLFDPPDDAPRVATLCGVRRLLAALPG